jgi:hypothetical protein
MWVTPLANVADSDYITDMDTTTRPETSQERLHRLMTAAQRRLPVDTTITNRRGTARWNGNAWVYGQGR